MENYTIEEMLAVEVSRHIHNDEMSFVGVGTGGKAYIRAVGIPAVASRLAQLSHAPDSMIMFGPIIDPVLDSDSIPETNNEYDLIHWPCRSQTTVYDSHVVFKAGRMGVGFVSGAQVDQYGNINIVCIGDYNKPKVRLPGSLAQPDHLAYAKRVFAIIKHDKRTLVEHVDYISGCGNEHREGLKGGGLALVFTELAVMDFNDSGKMRLKSMHPGVSLQNVIDNTGFALDIPEHVMTTEPPSEEQLKLIRERIDPKRKWLNANITQEPTTLTN